jgi:hypothetical protein
MLRSSDRKSAFRTGVIGFTFGGAALALTAGCRGGPPGEGESTGRATLGLSPDLPEIPAIQRDVSLVQGGKLLRPAIPPLRTSSDGRLGVSLKEVDGKVGFYLVRPESLSSPLLTSAPGVNILAATSPYAGGLDAALFQGAKADRRLMHTAMCDGTTTRPLPGQPSNPRACGLDTAFDCYDLSVIASFGRGLEGSPTSTVELWQTPITVVVSDPKTPSAQIESVITGVPVLGPTLPVHDFTEPTVTADGRLLVARFGGALYPWTNPATGETRTQLTTIVYSVYPEGDAPCDVTKWTTLSPISHAPYDPAMRHRYGIAEYPLRDGEGNLIPDGTDVEATYPWIDRRGSNLFFTATAATLFYWDPSAGGGEVRERYPAACVAGQKCLLPASRLQIGHADANDEPTRGFGFAGLWSHGKMVLMDSPINNTDYGFGRSDDQQRVLSLYAPGTAAAGDDQSGSVRVGSGRANSDRALPPGVSPNTAFIDSLENTLNHDPRLQPLTVRDVVWTVNTGKGSAEIAFDESLDADGFIVSDMGASTSIGGGAEPGWQEYHDGFDQASSTDGRGFTRPVHLQNAATAVATRWIIPAYGLASGRVRVEPVALGGIAGKGLWLPGGAGDRLAYTVAPQPQDVALSPWFYGIFLDPRFADDGTTRQLLAFPDHTRIVLRGRHAIGYESAAGVEIATIPLPAGALGDHAWTHLGFVVKGSGSRVELSLDGFLYHVLDSPDAALFQMVPGDLVVGAAMGRVEPGFRGWIDDLVVLAEEPDPEVICNHARGTLTRMDPPFVGPWPKTALVYPPLGHQRLTARLAAIRETGATADTRYACYHDYTTELDPGTNLRDLPAGQSIRAALLFPQGPLVYQVPRPDASSNRFCLTCHVVSQPKSLSLSALIADPTLTMDQDPRRQPMQPPPLVFGNVPAGYVAPGRPAAAISAPPAGLSLDQWVY